MTTEHVKIWLNNSQFIGLVVKPYTYRVNFSPTFFPRFSVGDMRGVDQARWRSWVQARFDEGEGQLLWSSALATNRYSQGHLVEVGRPLARTLGNEYIPGSIPVNTGGALNRDDSVVGDISPSLFPQPTSTGANNLLTYFTTKYPITVLNYSGMPMMWHWKSAFVYTAVEDTAAWVDGATEGYATKLTGRWNRAWTHSDTTKDFWISGAVTYSQITFISLTGALTDSDAALWKYGTVHTLGTTAATITTPVFNTNRVSITKCDRIVTYDEKLWRTEVGKVYYMEPSAGTSPAYWSEPYIPGDPGDPILNVREFNGRLYFGKSNALWTYDAGRLYRVEDFSSYTDKWNFAHMTVHRGYMYFNIKHMLFRLSTAGTLEQIQTYPNGGVIASAASVGDKLYYLARNPGLNPSTDVWVFDPETGGNFRLVNVSAVSKAGWGSPHALGTAQGVLFIAPMILTQMNTSQNIPVAALDPITPVKQQSYPYFADGSGGNESWFATSMLDFGLPTLMKAFNAVTVDYELSHQTMDYIDIYYITSLQQHNAVLSSFEHDYYGAVATSFVPTINLVDGDITTGRDFLFGPSSDTGPGSSTHIYPMWVVGIKSDETKGSQPYSRNDISRIRWTGAYAPGVPAGKEILGWSWQLWWYYVGYGGTSWQRCKGALNWKTSYVPASNPGDVRYLVVDVDIPYSTLQSMRMQPTYTSDITLGGWSDSLGLQTWFALSPGMFAGYGFPSTFQARSVDIPGSWKSSPIEDQDWTYLGRIGGSSDDLWREVTRTRKTLSFPKGLIGQQIMLKFEFHGTKFTRAAVRRYEVEWMPTPGALRTYQFVVPIAENVEMPDLTVRANAMSIATTLFSCAGSGKPYVIQMPWPGQHTISGQVIITAPGGVVPSLRDDDIDDSYAEIPIQIDAM